MDLIKIGRYVAGKRKEKGLTQKQVADTLGMSDKSVSKWERGICLPDVSVYEDYCEILGISINEFLAGEDIEQENIVKKSEENLISIAADSSRRRKRTSVTIAALLIFAVLAAVVTFAVTNLSASAKVARYEQKAAYYQTQIDDLQQKIAHYQVQIGEVQEKARSLQSEEAYQEAAELLKSGDIAHAAMRFGAASGYKDARERSLALWNQLLPMQTISAGQGSMAVLQDGTVVAAGDYESYRDNLASALPDIKDVLEVSYGSYVVAFLKADRTVEVVNLVTGRRVTMWDDIVKVSAGVYEVLGLRADGRVLRYNSAEGAFGGVEGGKMRPVEDFSNWDDSAWTDIVDLDAGFGAAVGLKADGTVVAAWAEVYRFDAAVLEKWSDIVSVDAGDSIYGLRRDGTVAVCSCELPGSDELDSLTEQYGQKEAAKIAELNDRINAGKAAFAATVESWKNVVSISAGTNTVAGIRQDGSIVVSGVGDFYNDFVVKDIIAISAGSVHIIALSSDGTVITIGSNEYGGCDISDWKNVRLPG